MSDPNFQRQAQTDGSVRSAPSSANPSVSALTGVDTLTELTEGDDNELLAFLAEHDLEKYAERLRAEGVHRVSHLRDVVEEECIAQWGMSRVEARRLVRVYEKWKKHHRLPITKRLVSPPSLLSSSLGSL